MSQHCQSVSPLDQASALYIAGDFKGMLEKVNGVIEKAGPSKESLVLRAMAHENLGAAQSAITDYRAAMAFADGQEALELHRAIANLQK